MAKLEEELVVTPEIISSNLNHLSTFFFPKRDWLKQTTAFVTYYQATKVTMV